MKTQTVVKEAGDTALQALAGAGGFGAGLFIGSKIPPVGFGPDVLKTHMQKMTPGLALIVLSYLAGTKIDNDYAKAAALGTGFSGAVLILKNYLPADTFRKFFVGLNGGMGNAPARTIDMAQDKSGSYQMLNGLGQVAENAYQLLN